MDILHDSCSGKCALFLCTCSYSRTRTASFPFVLVMVCNSDFTFASIRLYPKAFTVPKIGWPAFNVREFNITI